LNHAIFAGARALLSSETALGSDAVRRRRQEGHHGHSRAARVSHRAFTVGPRCVTAPGGGHGARPPQPAPQRMCSRLAVGARPSGARCWMALMPCTRWGTGWPCASQGAPAPPSRMTAEGTAAMRSGRSPPTGLRAEQRRAGHSHTGAPQPRGEGRWWFAPAGRSAGWPPQG
jgi:hypothetical protein